jgi:ppGpp synthetase/RelA/SpoT-type nucleotidyltranferase
MVVYPIKVHTRSKVDAAGDTLIKGAPQPYEDFDAIQAFDDALTVINSWRACHRYPLNAIQVTIRRRAKHIDPGAIVPQRLKRMPAIEQKLRLHEGMKLSRMHDIGGCRAILKDIKGVREVARKCREAAAKNPTRSSRLIREYNYLDGNIPGPKTDGYRGIHMVYQYYSTAKEGARFNGLRIEVQIRSQLQHAFSTAVETASIFTDQPIKSIKANLHDSRWRRFFALMGNAIAMREGTTLIGGLPTDQHQLAEEIRRHADDLSVERILSGWGKTIERLSGHPADAKTFLLVLDTELKTTEVIAYSPAEIPKTDEAYLSFEKQFKSKPSQQVVLVDAESIDSLRIGYPNFYLDTEAFIEAMKAVIDDV